MNYCLRCKTPKHCSIYGCAPGGAPTEDADKKIDLKGQLESLCDSTAFPDANALRRDLTAFKYDAHTDKASGVTFLHLQPVRRAPVTIEELRAAGMLPEAQAVRKEANPWLPICTTKESGIIQLLVEAAGVVVPNREVFVGQYKCTPNGWVWMIVSAAEGWVHLHPRWVPISWKPLAHPNDA